MPCFERWRSGSVYAALLATIGMVVAGDTLKAMKERGELAEQGGDRKSTSHDARLITLDDLGLTYSQSSRYQQEASVPDDLAFSPHPLFW